MHTLHTKAAAIFTGWAQEAEATEPATDSVSHGPVTAAAEETVSYTHLTLPTNREV